MRRMTTRHLTIQLTTSRGHETTMEVTTKSFAGDDGIKQTWFGKGNKRNEFPVSSDHESIKSARKSVRKDLEVRWVTNLREERKRFYLIETLLDPRIKMMSFCDNQYFSS
jgi:hypothetical protein